MSWLGDVVAVLLLAGGCMVWGWLQLRGVREREADCGECRVCGGDEDESAAALEAGCEPPELSR